MSSTALSAPPRPGGVTDRLAEVRRIVRTTLDRADDARRARQDRRVRVLALAQTLPTWGSLAPVVLALQQRTDATVSVVAVDGPTDVPGSVAADLTRQGLDPCSPADLAGRLDEFDVALLCDPYDEHRPPHLRLASLLEHGLRVAYSPYAENIGGEVALQYDTALHNLAWRIFVPDLTQRALYAQHCRAGDGHVRALGSVKGDWLAASDDAARRAALALRTRLGTRTVVLWNPHFRRGEGGWSTFERYVNDVLAFAARHPRVGVVVRPHFRLFPDLQAVPGGPGFVAAFRTESATLANLVIDEGADYRPAFAASDALVSDLSSLIPEYLRLGKPVAYLRHPQPPATVAEEAWLPRVRVIDDAAQLTRYLGSVTRARPTSRAASALPDVGAGERVAAAIVEDVQREVWPP